MRIVILFLLGFSLTSVEAQKKERLDETGNKVVGFGAGLSLTGLYLEADYNNDTIDYISNARVALQAHFDYFTSKKISIGVQSSIQNFKVYVNSWDFETKSGTPRTVENVSVNMNRVYVGARILLHYKNTTKLDVYSGIRAGAVYWSKKFSIDDNEFEKEFQEEFPFNTRQSIGLIALGSRVKFTPEIAAQIELNIGAPYLFAFGASYTFKK